MPWHIEENHADCESSEPWAVVKDDTEELEGCHESREDAEEQIAALEAAEDEDDDGDGDGDDGEDASAKVVTASGRVLRYDSQLMNEEMALRLSSLAPGVIVAQGEEHEGRAVPFEGVAVVEGAWTGDGRRFEPGSLAWPDLDEAVVPLQWQKETNHGGITDITVNVGRLTELERVGERIMVRGFIDTGSEDGAEVVRRMQSETPTLGGVSIVADDPENSEVELVWPEGCEEIDDKTPDEIESEVPVEDLEKCFMPEGVIFHGGRIRALTLVDVPAFVEAFIQLALADDVDDEDPMSASGKQTLGAVPQHETGTTDDAWDAAENVDRLDSPMSVDTAAEMYAWLDYDAIDEDENEITKAGTRFPHHMVGENGQPGMANLTACSSIIGILNGAQGGTDIPREEMEGVYNHVAKHLRDGDREPPPPTFASIDAIGPLVAASHMISIPDTPPASWFEKPSTLPPVGAITVTDEGRLYGLLAPAKVAHRSFPGERITVPMGNVDYTRWMNRERILDDGARIHTGAITMECGHADTSPWMTGAKASDHYDNSCAIVATACVGESKEGVWIAGALLPDVSPAQVARMLACQLSGDWRPHREKPGKRELAGALLVPVPGFPLAARPQLKISEGSLVSSAAPVRWLAVDDVTVPDLVPEDTTVENDTPDDAGDDTLDDAGDDTADSTVDTDGFSSEVDDSSADDKPITPDAESPFRDIEDVVTDLPTWAEVQERRAARAAEDEQRRALRGEIDKMAEDLGLEGVSHGV